MCEKRFFLYSHEYRDQKRGGKKLAKQFFQKHTNSASKKCLEKNVRKIVQKRFLYSHEYHDQKIGGIKRAKQFFRKHTNSASKNVEEKIVGKKCEIRFFYIYTQTSLPKNGGGGGNARNNFSRNTRIV